MKRFIIVFLFVLTNTFLSVAQDCDCYTSTRSQAVQLMSQGKYSKAITFLQAAKDCPDKPASDDLDRKIQECRDAIKRIEEEKRLAEQRRQEEENRRRLQQEEAWRRKAYMDIKGMAFGNTTKSDDVITPYGSTLYAQDIKYLCGRITYDGKCSSSKSLTLYVKIYKPDGTLMSGSSSPAGYTYSWSTTVYSGSGKTMNVGGWGNDSGTTYTNGTYRWEVWYDGSKIYENAVYIQRKPGTVTYLYVDSKSAVSANFSSYGGSETFYVSTDASSWTTWGIPSWCTVENKTASSFVIRCKPNTSPSTRTDYMKIQAGDKEVRIDISQAGDANAISAEIKSVRVDYDVYQDGYKGMLIHVNFDVENCRSVPCRCAAYFYFSDGTALKDYNGSYKTSDGHVSTGTDFTPSYDSSNYSDLRLFIPYNELHLTRSGTHSCYFEVNLYRKRDSKFFDTEYKESFTISY